MRRVASIASTRRWPLRLVGSSGMVRATVSISASRAAPNSFTRSGPTLNWRVTLSLLTSDASETSPCRRAGNAKRRARPPKGDGLWQACSGGIETSVRSGTTAVGRVGSVRRTLGRRAASVGEGSIVVEGKPVAGARANPKPTGSGVCRNGTCKGSVSQENVSWKCGRRECPS